MTAYEPTADEVELATHWHTGAPSLLYAIASTGRLDLGTRRPARTFFDDGRIVHEPITDDEWADQLRARLCAELVECEPHAPIADGIVFRQWIRKLKPGRGPR